MRHFTVTVKLIAEKIGDDDDLRPELIEDLARRGLVALDDGILLAAFAGQGAVDDKLRGYAGNEVSPRTVGKITFALLKKGLLDHAGAGGLTVCAGDGDGPDVLCQKAQQLRIYFERDAAGHRRAAAVQDTRDKTQRLAHQHCQYCSEIHRRTPCCKDSCENNLYSISQVYSLRQEICLSEYVLMIFYTPSRLYRRRENRAHTP